MKILEIRSLEIPEVKVIRYARFHDHRGYFTEHYRKSDFLNSRELEFMKGIEFLQSNESHSKKGTVRGLHFQWNPKMGKLVRPLAGRMIDLILDIRKGSPYFGKIIAYDMPVHCDAQYGEWIWVPQGFAHGNFFSEDSMIEYFCSGEYSPGCEAGISPLASDLDWSMCDQGLKDLFCSIISSTTFITEKDRNGFSIEGWKRDARSDNFVYTQIPK